MLYAPSILGESLMDDWFDGFDRLMSQMDREWNQPVYGKKVSDLTMMDLQKILNSNSDHPRACEQLRLTIRQLCRQAVRDGILKRDISDGLQIPKCPKPSTRFLTSEEVEKILAIDFDEQDKLFIDVIYHTGMRPAEALALQWSDIDKKNNVIHVRRAFEFESNKPKVKTTKTGVSRDIPVTSSFTQMLLRRSKTSVFVFLCGDAPFTRSAYFTMSKRVFGRIKEEIGIEGVTFYTFRHTFATNLYYDGVKPGIITTKEAATICGHSEHIFLTRYTHLDDSRENIDELLKRMFG